MSKDTPDKRPVGRPTSYSEDMQQRADEYVDGGFIAAGDVVPSVAGLAVELRVDRATLHNWRDQHPVFLGTLNRLSHLQERLSLNGGLSGKLNSTIVKLLLANHGYSDRQDVNHQSHDGSMTPTRIEIVSPGDHDDSEG